MLRLVPNFKKMILENCRGNPSPVHQETLFAQEGIAWLLCANVFPVLVTGNIVFANMQIKEGTCRRQPGINGQRGGKFSLECEEY